MTIDTCLNIISLFFGFLLLLIAFFAYRSFAKNQLLQKQIDFVLELTKEIQNTRFEVNFFNEQMGEGKFLKKQYTLFDILRVVENAINHTFKDNNIYLKEGYEFELTFLHHCENLLMPKKIAEALKAFWNNECTIELSENLLKIKNYILMGKQVESSDTTIVLIPHGSAYKNWEVFVNSSKYLKMTIVEWIRANGIKEINI